MTLDPAFDGVVWGVSGLVLALMAARAWAVESSRTRLGRATRRVRGLTALTGAALVGLVVLLGVQGGAQFVQAVVIAKTQGTAAAEQYLQGPRQQQPAAPAPAAPAPAAPAPAKPAPAPAAPAAPAGR